MARYNYWDDLKTDLRWPKSGLDLVNMLLRRVGLILIWHYWRDAGIHGDWQGRWRLHWWPDFCRRYVEPIEQEGRGE